MYLECNFSQRHLSRDVVLSEKVDPDKPVVEDSLGAAVSFLGFHWMRELDQRSLRITFIPHLQGGGGEESRHTDSTVREVGISN